MYNDRDHKLHNRNELLTVSFGTTSAESRLHNIDAVEQAIKDAVGDDWIVRRCFTSQTIINLIHKREGIRIDSVEEALQKAKARATRNIVIQPTHLMKGLEYEKIKVIVSEYERFFESITLGDPLLSSEEDLVSLVTALTVDSAEFDDSETALVFMGHGTEAAANDIYRKIQNLLISKGMYNYFIGTVEAEPSLEDVLSAVAKGSYSRVVLRPLMLVAGNHAVNDMASADDPDSWYSRFTAAGYETTCIIKGLGQIPEIRDIYAEHAKKAVSQAIHSGYSDSL